jgi:Na+/H+ antiporter NhaD/arsenite permease-like protein
MHGDDEIRGVRLRHGPHIWLLSLGVGLGLGVLGAKWLPMVYDAAGLPVIPLWLVAPFALLLASIALMPFVSERVWHRHFPDFSFFFGGLIAGYCLAGITRVAPGHSLSIGQHAVVHALAEYYAFVALVCGLFVVSGGILVRVDGRGRPGLNTALLALGAVLANVVGTTGASMLLIRPFMRLNEGRLRPIHVVLFIMIVSNCGGALTPIGDPPLYLGFLKGVPFFYPLTHFWGEWLLVVASLLIVYFVVDTRIDRNVAVTFPPLDPKTLERRPFAVSIRGGPGLICLALMIAGVFIDPALKSYAGIEGYPAGATFQLLVAVAAYTLADRKIHEENQFSFFPVKEVGLLFLGIFLTMIPALGYLAVNGGRFGLTNPTAYYFATGGLSAILDNAPTYLNFLQISLAPAEVSKESIAAMLATDAGRATIAAISTSAVFFGAMTYIGNGPNFMVRAIAQSAGVRMPSFFGYVFWAVVILLPILIVNWFVFIR